MRNPFSLLAAAAVAAFALSPVPALSQAQEEGGQAPPTGRPGGPTCDPSFGGKYQTLLRRLHVPGDVRQYGTCRDYGRWSGYSYRGYTNLPNGYWTYASPYWYIWQSRRQ